MHCHENLSWKKVKIKFFFDQRKLKEKLIFGIPDLYFPVYIFKMRIEQAVMIPWRW